LGKQPCRERGADSTGVHAFAFVIVEDAKARHEMEQLVVCERELLPSRVLATQMVVDEKGFVDQDSSRFECSHQEGKEGPVQVIEPDDDLIGGFGNLGWAIGILEIHEAGCDGSQASR
jgi:hypothetical protein